jgi:hypothetical protein
VTNKFPNVSEAKIEACIFIGPQIRELMQDKQFDEDLNETENPLSGVTLGFFSRYSR